MPTDPFEVICAGEALWRIDDASDGFRFRPGGGAVNAALALASQGLRVGLATVLPDDEVGRSLQTRAAALGVNVAGVALAPPRHGLLLVEPGARQVIPLQTQEQTIAIPEGWSSQVLLLSGLSPVVSHAAALCRAARAARRAGTTVVVDVNARWHLWRGRDPRTIRMVVKEADVLWCSAEDLFGLNMDADTLRAALRPTAVLVMTDGTGTAHARGPFGEIARSSPRTRGPLGEGDAFTAAICAELARAGHAGGHHGEIWARALERGHETLAAASAR